MLGTNAPGYDTYTYANPVKVGRRLLRVLAGGGRRERRGPGRVLVLRRRRRHLAAGPGAAPERDASGPTSSTPRRGDTIHVAYTEGHPNATQTGIRYAAFRDGQLYRADGTAIGAPPVSAMSGERVYRAKPRAWVWDVAADSEGRPVIVYATFPGKTDHRYRYARWNGKRWIDVQLARAGGSIVPGGRERQYSGGIALDHGDPSTVYLSRQDPRRLRDRALAHARPRPDLDAASR